MSCTQSDAPTGFTPETITSKAVPDSTKPVKITASDSLTHVPGNPSLLTEISDSTVIVKPSVKPNDSIVPTSCVKDSTITKPLVKDTTATNPVVKDTATIKPVVIDTVVIKPVVKDTTVTKPVVKDTTVTKPVVKDTTVTKPVVKDTAIPITIQPPIITTPPGSGSILLATDLEDQSTSCWNNRNSSGMALSSCGVFSSIGASPFVLAQGGITHSGSQAIRITYAKNEEFAGTNVSIYSDSVNVRSYYYFDTNFDFGQGMKIGRVSSFNSAAQLNDVDIIMAVRSSGSVNQCGVTDMRDMGIFFNGAPKGSDWGNVSADVSFQRGRWYAVEYQVVMNTPGLSDGKIRLWVDGVKVAERTNLPIRGSLGSSVKLNTVKIGGWYSNSAGGNTCANPSQPSTLYMDDIVIAKSFIGTSIVPNTTK